MNKEKKIQRKLQLTFLKKMKIALNFQIQTIGMDKEKDEEQKSKEFGQLLDPEMRAEIEEIKLRRNKFGSSKYEFIPFIGLNRKQRRNLKRK